MKRTPKKQPPRLKEMLDASYYRVTSSEVLNRLFQYGVFDGDESLDDVVKEVSQAAREMRKLRKEHGGQTELRKVVKHYVERERGYVEEMRQAVANMKRSEPRGE